MSKYQAWGGNVLLRIKDPSTSEGGIIIAGEKKAIQPVGIVVSCGSLVRDFDYLEGRKVSFDPNMVRRNFDSDDGVHVFLIVPEAALLAVIL